MATPSQHIAILTPGFPANETDTTCIPALWIYIKALHQISGYTISIISFHYPKSKSTYLWHGIPVYALGGGRALSKMLLWKKAYTLLKKLHNENPISVLHSFWLGECALLAHWFSKKNNLKHLTTLMGQDALKGNGYAKFLPLQKMRFITISSIQQQIFYENYKINSLVIECGIQREDFHHPSEKTIDIIAVGSLIQLKNHVLFIDVIYKLNKAQTIKAVLIGEGVLEEKLRKKIALLDLENTIELIGKLDYEATLRYMAKSKILLHTAHYEGFGLVFAEALHSKTRIVSKEVGGALASENWAIADTEAKMVDACQKLLSQPFTEEQRTFFIEDRVREYLAVYDY